MKQADDEARWLYLVEVAQRILDATGGASHADLAPLLEEAEGGLRDVLEVFCGTIEPDTDLEGYAVRRLSRALLSVLVLLQEKR